jgi:hypothetical protein
MRTLLLLVLLFPAGTLRAQAPALLAMDLALVQGGWSGELMYINYTDGSEAHIPATLRVDVLGQRQWRIGFGYTDEPHANAMDTLVLSPDGHLLDDFAVLEVQRFTPDSVRFVLQAEGEDDNRPATLRKTWTVGPHTCTLRKDVRFMALNGEAMPFLLRHEYRFKR